MCVISLQKSLLTRGESLVKLSNSQRINFGVMSSRTLSHPAPTCFQSGVRESGHTLFSQFRVIIFFIFFFFFSKPAISLTEADQALLFSPNVSRVGGGVHRYVFFSQDVDTVERGRLCGTSLKYAIYAQAVAPPNAHNPHVLF